MFWNKFGIRIIYIFFHSDYNILEGFIVKIIQNSSIFHGPKHVFEMEIGQSLLCLVDFLLLENI
jgi:hypothetical protein